ncbi:MAG: tetratricopeptide repeat protein [Candidatus Hydrogenedentes bacterium]|nr:tetratricopeptide repeat protein [Candidatus Hydrogenedentota bacterium]
MTADTPSPTDCALAPVAPRGAYEVLLAISAIAFLVLAGALIGYRVYGAQLTAGLDAACAEASFQAGQKFEAQGNLAQAVLKYRQALGGRFSNDESRFMCGRAIGDLLVRQGMHEEATEAYDELPPEAFRLSGHYTGYVTALWRTGALERARKLGEIWLEKADAEADSTQRVWARHVLHGVAREEGDVDAALRYGRDLLAIDPGHSTANTVARLLIDRGEFDAAREVVETMLRNTESPGLRRAGERVLQQIAAAAAGKSDP